MAQWHLYYSLFTSKSDSFCLQIIFLETICTDRQIIERNIRLKIQQSPDYAEEYDHFLIASNFLIISSLLRK